MDQQFFSTFCVYIFFYFPLRYYFPVKITSKKKQTISFSVAWIIFNQEKEENYWNSFDAASYKWIFCVYKSRKIFNFYIFNKKNFQQGYLS